jgi:hypothetical protein
MNPNKCAFGVSAGEFLGFLVHEGGIEVGKKSMKAIDEVVPPTNLKELQSLLGKINFVRRFISNLSQKVLPFSPLLKLKKDQKFTWGDEQQKAFDEIKQYMKEPPVLVPPQLDKPFKLLYLSETSGTEEWMLGARNPSAGTKSRRSQKHLPPTSASRAMRRSGSAWQRAVMSLRPCSRCRTRRRS